MREWLRCCIYKLGFYVASHGIYFKPKAAIDNSEAIRPDLDYENEQVVLEDAAKLFGRELRGEMVPVEERR